MASARRADASELPELARMLARALLDNLVAVWRRLPRGPRLWPMWRDPR